MEFRYYISNRWTKDEAFLVMEACEFAAKFYGLESGVTTIKLVNQDEQEATAERLKNNRFEVRLNKSKITNLLETVFHEMTHVKQFMKDGLRLEVRKWKGSHYPDTDYWFSPWEMEARAMEGALAHLFKVEVL